MKTGDKIIFIIVILSLLVGIIVKEMGISNTSTKFVVIMADGKVYEKIPLIPNLKPSTIMVKSKEGYLYVEIDNGKVHVLDSTCPDKLCIKQGWISNVGETIVCLPNRITISIVGGNESVDSVSY